MKKEIRSYEKPTMQIVSLCATDIITASYGVESDFSGAKGVFNLDWLTGASDEGSYNEI